MTSEIKSIPVEHLIKQVETVKRDKTQALERRRFFVNCTVLETAAGSAYIEMGDTKVLCSVDGPREMSRETASNGEKGSVQINLKYAPFASRVRLRRDKRTVRGDVLTENENNLADLLRDALTPVVILDKYPKAQIDVQVCVLQDDGGVLPAALTCAPIALADAGIHLYDMVLATQVALLEDDTILVDPSTSELSNLVCTSLTVGLMPSLNQVCMCYLTGQCTSPLSRRLLATASDCSYTMFSAVRTAVSKAVNKKNK